MDAGSYFKEGERDIVQIGRNFEKWFIDMPIEASTKDLYYMDMDGYLATAEILKKFKPTDISLGDFKRTYESVSHLVSDGRFNVFFIRDKDKNLRLVDVYWSLSGWVVCSRTVDEDNRCIIGRIFSYEPFSSAKSTKISYTPLMPRRTNTPKKASRSKKTAKRIAAKKARLALKADRDKRKG